MLPYAAFVRWADLAIRSRFCFLILKCFYNQLLTGRLRREMRRISGAATFVPMEKNPFCTLLLLRKVFYYSSFLHWSWDCCSRIPIHITSMDANLSEQSKSVSFFTGFSGNWRLQKWNCAADVGSAQLAFLWAACTANDSASSVNKRKDDIFLYIYIKKMYIILIYSFENNPVVCFYFKHHCSF